MSVLIRKAKREDMVEVMEMIKELVKFEGVDNPPAITHEDLLRDGFDSTIPKFVCLVAEDNGKLVGQIFGNFAYSTWTGPAMYVEDIYVREEYRHKKVGHKLLKAYCEYAKENGCSRIDWHVLMTNATAIEFYKRHGAFSLEEIENRSCMRMLKDAINLVASKD